MTIQQVKSLLNFLSQVPMELLTESLAEKIVSNISTLGDCVVAYQNDVNNFLNSEKERLKNPKDLLAKINYAQTSEIVSSTVDVTLNSISSSEADTLIRLTSDSYRKLVTLLM